MIRMWRTWRERRIEEDCGRVLAVLADGGIFYGSELWDRTRLSSGRLYVALARLRVAGKVERMRAGERAMYRLPT